MAATDALATDALATDALATDALATDDCASDENRGATAMAQDWQLILIHPYTGARRTFDSAEALMNFLQEQMNVE